jgi:hypothetical protein
MKQRRYLFSLVLQIAKIRSQSRESQAHSACPCGQPTVRVLAAVSLRPSLRPQATPDGSGRPNVTSSLVSCWFLSEHVQTVAQFLEDRAHRSELGPVVDLAWIVALIEELLAPIAVVANVDEAAFGQ